MRTKTKVWLIIAASLVLIGGILFAGVMTILRWNFMELSTVIYETNSYEISEVFDSISINTDTADIVFAFSDDEICRVECHEEENAKHSVTVKDGTLSIELIDNKSAYDLSRHIGLNFSTPKITVYLPKTEYTSLLIRVTTGDVYLSDINCKNLASYGTTSDMYLDNVITTENLLIKTNTGDVMLDGCDAAEISIETSTGDVLGSLLSDKVFITEVSTGDINVPHTTTGGVCRIKTSTGDINITLK